MNNRTIRMAVISLTSILLIFTGCKGRQAVTGEHLPPIPTEHIVGDILAAQPQFNTMNLSKTDMRLHYGNYDFTLRSSIKMIRDSVIAVSVQPAIGIEMFRIIFDRNGFTVIDKMNRRFAENPYEYLRLKYGLDVNLHHFQELLSNRLFSVSNDTALSEMTFTPVFTGDSAIIRDTVTLSGHRKLYFTVERDFRISAVTVGSHPDMADAQISYSEISDFDRIPFPAKVNLRVTIPGKRPLSSEITVNKAEFNGDVTINSTDLSKYKKVTLGELIP